MSELKPCFKCGDLNLSIDLFDSEVRCECGLTVRFYEFYDLYSKFNDGEQKKRIIEAWNTRPLEDSLKAHAVEVLAEEIAKNKFDVYDDKIEWRYPYGLKTAYMLEKERDECIKEARALLGWEE